MEQRYREVGALLGSDAEAYDYFGASIAVAGNRLVIGVPGKDSLAVNTGIVYVYDWNGTVYVEVGRIIASDAAAHNYFGLSVALSGDGDRLAVGAHVEDAASVDAGKVYIFDWNSATSMYDDVSQLTAFDPRAGEWFGGTVALTGDGTRLVVGATCDATATDNAGKVYVYDWNSDTCVYDEVTTISASDAQTTDWFGSSVAISGNRLVVGTHTEATAGANAGKVYVYDWNSDTDTYDEVTTISATGAEANGQFGVSVVISSDTLVVGVQCESSVGVDAGAVCIYIWNSDTSAYDEVSTITASDAEAYDYFGIAVALSSDSTRLLVGALTRNASLVNAGKVYGYDLQSANEEQ